MYECTFTGADMLLQGLWVLSGVSRYYVHVLTVSCEPPPEDLCEKKSTVCAFQRS